jgi:hypothetical protein
VTEHSRDQREHRPPQDASPESESEPEAQAREELDEVGRESFPASDPPASWAGPPADAPDEESRE